MPLDAKPVSASAIEDHTAIVFPNDLNAVGTLFGGRVLEMGDILAAIVAKRHAGRTCITLGIDSVRFLAPARHGDILVFKTAVNRVWRTSMEVGLKVFADDFHTMARQHIVSAYFTFVGVDESHQPVEICPVIPETKDERRRFADADVRRKYRMARTESAP
ncbi:MAG: acyl-CoA thioesterase [Tepidisphaeraceae bacterium]